jgi:nucleotide-binding universal stress UspA family protein
MSEILKRVVVGVDGSPSAAEAIALAIRLARTHRSELYFSYAVDYALAASDAGAAVIDALTSEGTQILHKAKAIAANEGFAASTKVLEGRPEYAVVRHAQDITADAIVVGTRGKAGVERFFLGSTAEGVLRLAGNSGLRGSRRVAYGAENVRAHRRCNRQFRSERRSD